MRTSDTRSFRQNEGYKPRRREEERAPDRRPIQLSEKYDPRSEEYNSRDKDFRRREFARTTSTNPYREKESADDYESTPPRLTRRARFNDPDSGFGKRSHNKPTSPEVFEPRNERRAADRMAIQRNPDGSKLSASRLAYLERPSSNRDRFDTIHSTSGYSGNGDYFKPSRSEDKRRDGYERPDAGDRQSRGVQDYVSDLPFGGNGDRYKNRLNTGNSGPARRAYNDGAEPRLLLKPDVDKRVPLSIPYTTPASDFLYGTSVVEAALRSINRRKLYKLYIYAGENRDNANKDSSIEQLAKKAEVEVVHLDGDSIRLMDKMSGGRPHNGYILEASPLPRLPVLSLGPLASAGSTPGFSVALDHQSREEAAINGTSDFISIPQDPSGRKPFVVLLDSIQDPGNLGGIIRSACFLGVTAIAISTRNSASFTPVVLKASAGASENITIFSVNKPAEFLEFSQKAGWQVYAAVAPSLDKKTNGKLSTTTHELGNPLLVDPCILVLGSEGQGLRWHIRRKADCELSIPGEGGRGGIDSLNVSVAAGILCDSFLKNRHPRTPEETLEMSVRPKSDLF